MPVTPEKIVHMRKHRGWSQEKLSAMSGVSERTIQRVEKGGNCSLDTQLALASAFDVTPADIASQPLDENQDVKMHNDWTGAVVLFLFALAFVCIVLFTGTNGMWELISFFTVMGLTVALSLVSNGIRETYRLFDKTSWIVRYPVYANNLPTLIRQAHTLIKHAYTVGTIAMFFSAITLLVHARDMSEDTAWFITVTAKPLLYAVCFVELWFRPFKRKMERMLRIQSANHSV